VSVILSKKVYMQICPVQNGFRDRTIPLYSSKIVDKKEILRTVSNTGMYCSSDKVSTVYLV
jgi:predicted transport protein